MLRRFSLFTFTAIVLCLLSIAIKVPSVSAQETLAPSPSATNSGAPNADTNPSPAPTAVDPNQEIETLTTTYHGQLEEYRTAEKNYQIATTQYQQLNTLVSLEDALQATKQAMLTRDQVLVTYVTLLQRMLSNTPGINLDQKNKAVQALLGEGIALQKHLADTQQSQTKEEITQRATDFKTLGDETQTAVYTAQSLIAVGKLQTIYDKAVLLSADIDQNLVATTSDIKQGQRQRAIDEIKSSLAQAKMDIDETVQRRIANNTSFSQTNFENTLQSLNQVYVDLSQSLSFLDQLMRI